VALFIFVVLAMAAFSVDVGYMQLTRTELRSATDSSARAGVEALVRLQSTSAAKAAAIAAAKRNLVAGVPLDIDDNDIEFGRSSYTASGKWLFSPGQAPYNAMRVTGRRTKLSNDGPVALFLGHMFGRKTFEPQRQAVASQLARDICLVIDRSGSMAWDLSDTNWSYPPGIPGYPQGHCTPPHPTLSRWAASSNAVATFLIELNNTQPFERVALASYSSPVTYCNSSYSQSSLDQQLTVTYEGITNSLAQRSQSPICGGTSISGGIDTAVAELTGPNGRAFADRTIIVLTDGVHNYGRSPVSSAQDADAANIRVHTITFSEGADQDLMQDVADAAGGNHYHAPDAETLSAIFIEIARTLPIVVTE